MGSDLPLYGYIYISSPPHPRALHIHIAMAQHIIMVTRGVVSLKILFLWIVLFFIIQIE